MGNKQSQAVATVLDTADVLVPGHTMGDSEDVSLSTIASNGFSSPQASGNSAGLSSPESGTHLTLQALIFNPHEVCTDNSKDSIDGNSLNAHVHPSPVGSDSAMFSFSTSVAVSTTAGNEWIKTAMASDSASDSDRKEREAQAHAEATLVLLTFSNDGTARPAKRPLECNDEDREELVVQSPKRQRPRRTSYPTLRTLGADSERERQAASLPRFSNGFKNLASEEKPARTPLGPSRISTEINVTVTNGTLQSIAKTALSQTYSESRGWTAVNHITKAPLRRENDLYIPINTIIPAANAYANPGYERTMSAPAEDTSKMSARVSQLPPSFLRAAPSPVIPSDGSKAKKGKKSSSLGTASDECSSSNKTKTSTEAKAMKPKINATAARRKKWSGKSMPVLILEALRAAKSTNYTLSTRQVKAYIEKYRRTTDMEFEAHSQTIRASLHKNYYPKNPKGLWEHVVPTGKRTGPYRLLPQGFAADAVVPEDDEKEEM